MSRTPFAVQESIIESARLTPRPADARPAGARPPTLARVAAGALALSTALVAVTGCSGDEAGGTTVARQATTAAAPSVIAASDTPYRATPGSTAGSVTGSVRVAGDLPADTTVRPTMDQRVCGASFVDRTIVRSGTGLGNVVVWLVDARAGKPLPLRRRFTIDNVRCRLEPRVQAVVAGGTLNVTSSDALYHRTRAERFGTGELLGRWEHNDFGEVVPDDRVLRAPGLVELRSDVHPWTRAFIAVFDHPYFAVTAANGGFSLADVPPGSYTLAAWHERLGRIEQRVTVTAGSATPTTLTFGETPVGADGGAPTPAAATRAER